VINKRFFIVAAIVSFTFFFSFPPPAEALKNDAGAPGAGLKISTGTKDGPPGTLSPIATPASTRGDEYDHSGSRSSFEGLRASELTVENYSQRSLTVKVLKVVSMKKTIEYGPAVRIEPMARYGPIELYETGDYYVKVKSEYPGREPVYSKGGPFRVEVGLKNYSALTIKYSFSETTADSVYGARIDKSEFERNEE